MRILFVTNLYPNRNEPTRATFNRQLAVALNRLGHDVHIIAPVSASSTKRPPARDVIDGLPIDYPLFFYPPKMLVSRHDFFYRISIARKFRRVMADFVPDVVMLGFIFPDAAAIAPLCHAAGMPYVVRVNGSDFRVRIRQDKFSDKVKAVLRDAPAIICPGRRLKQEIDGARIADGTVVAFDNGINHDLFYPVAGSVADTDVLFVGNLVSVKGPDRCLQACAALAAARTKPLVLRVIGDGCMKARLQSMAASESMLQVHFEGCRPHDQIADFIRRSRCVCLASRSEGMPNIVLESMACGVPVVATDVGEVTFLLRDGINGFIVAQAPEDTLNARLAEALASALGRTWDQAEIAAAVKNMTWQAAAEIVVGALELAIERTRCQTT